MIIFSMLLIIRRGLFTIGKGTLISFFIMFGFSALFTLFFDLLGLKSFSISLGKILFYSFLAKENGSFSGQIGFGVFYLALLAGFINLILFWPLTKGTD